MKRTWIAAIILSLTVAFCIVGFFTVEARGRRMTQLISICAQEVLESPNAPLTEMADKINKEWSNNSTLFKSIFIHTEFSEIETLLNKLHIFAQQDDSDLFYEHCMEAISRLHCALDDEKPKIENIF